MIGKSRRKLPFDFYLTDKKICIEYDGEQHYKPIEKFGGDKSLNRVKKNDELKNQYCNQNGIKLIRIPYTMNNKNIEPYIIQELNRPY
jgi:very-short-patch-repair endonuclease